MGPVTQWLDEEQQRTWRALLAAAAAVAESLERQLQRGSGMPHAYYAVLVALSEHPHRRLRMSELAAALSSSQSRLSHAVARLEERGWVRRERCDTDRRGSWAVLTDEGSAALRDAAPGHVEAVRAALFDRLTPEQTRALGELCAAVLAPDRADDA